MGIKDLPLDSGKRITKAFENLGWISQATVAAAHAQVPYNEGPVERVVLLHVTAKITLC